ncbi:unnamed protein product [Boreogadus saida]
MITPQGEPGATIADINFTKEDIELAIDEVDNYAATGHEDIPAKTLKSCKHEISVPLTILWKCILLNLNEGFETDVIYLDFAKAFNKVEHNILLQKLHNYGIRAQKREIYDHSCLEDPQRNHTQ